MNYSFYQKSAVDSPFKKNVQIYNAKANSCEVFQYALEKEKKKKTPTSE